MTPDLETVKSKVCELANDIQENRSNIGDLEAEIEELEQEISEKEGEIAQLLRQLKLHTVTVSDCFTYTITITGKNSVSISRHFFGQHN